MTRLSESNFKTISHAVTMKMAFIVTFYSSPSAMLARFIRFFMGNVFMDYKPAN